jgi:hypothetical protein
MLSLYAMQPATKQSNKPTLKETILTIFTILLFLALIVTALFLVKKLLDCEKLEEILVKKSLDNKKLKEILAKKTLDSKEILAKKTLDSKEILAKKTLDNEQLKEILAKKTLDSEQLKEILVEQSSNNEESLKNSEKNNLVQKKIKNMLGEPNQSNKEELCREIVDLRAQISSLKMECEGISMKKQCLEEITNSQNPRETLYNLNEKYTKEILNLKGQITNMHETIAFNRKNIHGLWLERSGYRNRNNALTKENANLQYRMAIEDSKKDKKLRSMQNEIDSLQHENNELREQNDNLENSRYKISQDWVAQENDLEIQEMKEKISNLLNKNLEFSQLQYKMRELKGKLQDNQQKSEKLLRQKNKALKQNIDLQQKIQDLKQEHEGETINLKRLNYDLNGYIADLQRISCKNRSTEKLLIMHEKITELRHTNELLQMIIEEMNDK